MQSLGEAVLELSTDDRKLLKGLGDAKSRVSSLSQGFTAAGAGITAFAAGGAAAIGGLASLAVSQESAFAGVKKTIDDTVEGFAALRAELTTLSNTIPGTFEAFSEIAEVGGQLGIARENIVSFTETIVRLGESTNLVGEEGATVLARFINVTDATQEQVSNLGSALVALGNNSATTEAEIARMATRIGLSGTQAGLSSDQILAFSAALSSAGITAESGGTNFSKFAAEVNTAVLSGGESLGAFAGIAGTSSEAFQKAFQEDAAGAISAFLEGMNQISESGGDVATTMADMGFESTEMQRIILALAGNTDLLSASLDLSASAFTDNTALLEESNKRFETSAAGFEILSNKAANLGARLGELLLPTLITLGEKVAGVIDVVLGLVEGLGPLGEQIGVFGIALVGIAAVVGPVLIGLGLILPAITAIFGPAGAIALAVGALIYLALTNDEVRDGLKAAWDTIEKNLSAAFGAIKEEVVEVWEKSIQPLFEAVADAITAVWETWGDTLSGIFKDTFAIIKPIIKGAWTIIKGLFSAASGVLEGTITTLKGALTGDFGAIKTGVITIVTALWRGIKGIFSGAATAVIGSVTGLGTGIINAFQNIKDAVVGNSIVPDMLTEIQAEFAKLGGEAALTPTNASLALVVTEFGNTKTDVGTTVGLMVTDVQNKFESLADGIVDKIVTGEGSLTNRLVGAFTLIKDTMLEIASDAVAGKLKKALSGLFEGGEKAAKDVATAAEVGEKAAEVGGQVAEVGGQVAGVGGQAAGVGGQVAGAAAGGPLAWVGAGAAVVSAVSDVISNFQFRAMNKALDRIVLHTLQTVNLLGHRADGGITRTLFRILAEIAFGTTNKSVIFDIAPDVDIIKTSTQAQEATAFNNFQRLESIDNKTTDVIGAINNMKADVVSALRGVANRAVEVTVNTTTGAAPSRSRSASLARDIRLNTGGTRTAIQRATA